MWTKSMACYIWWAWAANLDFAFQAAVIFSQVDMFPLGKFAGIEAGFFYLFVSWQAPSITLGAGGMERESLPVGLAAGRRSPRRV